MSHLVSPFGVAVAYENPEFKDFIGVPRSSVGSPGWGQPYVTPDGRPITPGTLGGPGQAAVVSEKNGAWTIRRNKNAQKFGEISWRGQKRSAKPTARRYVLSYHGPSTRYFPTPAFVYGSDSKHRNVYMSGGLVGIAPGPVLGACLRTIADKRYLFVVAMVDGAETVLRRAAGGPVYSDKDETLSKLAAYASTEHPEGWKVVGLVSIPPEYLPPQTPWFFNESGTEAQCVRQIIKQGTHNGETKDEQAGDRFKLVIGDACSTIPLGNSPAFAFTEAGGMTDLGMWDSPPDSQGYPHRWHEKRLQVTATCSGEQVVAVDYDGDTEIVIRAVIDVYYKHTQDYMKGMDQELYTGPGYPSYRNTQGEARYGNPLELGVDPAATVGNHMAECWWAGYAHTYLAFTKSGTEYRISLELSGTKTQTEYLGFPYNSIDHDLFQRYYQLQYVRHLDARAGGLIVTRLELFDEMVKQDTADSAVDETYDTNFDDSQVMTILEGSKTQKAFDPTYHMRLNRHPDASPLLTWDVASGLDIPGETGWPQTQWSWSADTWIGARPTNNDNEDIGKLPTNAWFPKESTLYRNSWYGMKVLYHDKVTESASFCLREDNTFILSGELPSPDTGEPENFLVTHPETLASAIDGAVYYPIGEL